MPFNSFGHRFGRRFALKSGLLLAGGLFGGNLLPAWTREAEAALAKPERSVNLYHINTCESLRTVYWQDGRYIPDAMRRVNTVLRDHHSDEVHPIDRELVDLMCLISSIMADDRAVHVICGYRSPHTNASMRERSLGVARRSLHTKGQAVDIRVPGRSLSQLKRVAMTLKEGGVGYYPFSDFVHVDVGDVRTW